MKAVVIGSGGPLSQELLKARCSEADLIVAADGGGRYLYEIGLLPHMLVGDFDSIPQHMLEFFRSKGVRISQYAREKDYTDLELAIAAAMEEGADEITILGGMGSRFDHTAANVFLLKCLLDKNIRACLEDDHNRIFLTDRSIEITKQENWRVSLLSISPEVTHVSTSGLAYPLNDETLRFGSSRGVSNEFAGDTACICFKKGLLMVILSCGD